MESEYEVTPVQLLQAANTWDDLYKYAIKKSTSHQVASWYCKFISLEMFLKAYIVFLNRKYSKLEELEKLGHNFNKMYEVLNELAEDTFISNLKKLLKKFNLFETNISELRYPEASRQTIIDPAIYEEGVFEEVTNKITKGIEDGIKDWRSK